MDLKFLYTLLAIILILGEGTAQKKRRARVKKKRGLQNMPECTGPCLPFRKCKKLVRRGLHSPLCNDYYKHPAFVNLFDRMKRKGIRFLLPVDLSTGKAMKPVPKSSPRANVVAKNDVIQRSPVQDVRGPLVQQKFPSPTHGTTTPEPETYRDIRRVVQDFQSLYRQPRPRITEISLPAVVDSAPKPLTHMPPPPTPYTPPPTPSPTAPPTTPPQPEPEHDSGIRDVVRNFNSLLAEKVRSQMQEFTPPPDPAVETTEGWRLSGHVKDMIRLSEMSLMQLQPIAEEVGCNPCTEDTVCPPNQHCYHSLMCGEMTCHGL